MKTKIYKGVTINKDANGKKVNYSNSEFCTIEAMRKYCNAYRVLLVSGFRHTTLKEYINANILAGN